MFRVYRVLLDEKFTGKCGGERRGEDGGLTTETNKVPSILVCLLLKESEDRTLGG